MTATDLALGLVEEYLALTAAFRDPPDFLIIGAQRGGTTSLYRYLAQHPQVLPALLAKGVHYFDVHADRSTAWYRGHFPANLARSITASKLGLPIRTGEASPYYLFHPHAPKRAAAVVPNARLIVMLREPIARAMSHHRHEVAGGFEPLHAFEDALAAEPQRLDAETVRLERDERYVSFAHQHFSYLARGKYAEQLARWWRYFARDQTLVLSSERFFRDPGAELARVTSFLDVEPITNIRFQAYNATAAPAVKHAGRPDVHPATLARLRTTLAPMNRELFSMLDDDLAWED